MPEPATGGQRSRRDVLWLRRRLAAWRLAVVRDFPWRGTPDPFHILLAEVLLQATYSGKVVPVYDELVERFPTPAQLAAADVDIIRAIIRPLGLQSRAATLIALANAILRDHEGQVPQREAALRQLPGVGPYTAAAVRAFAFEHHAAAIDTNGVRILERFYGLPSPPGGYRGVVAASVLQLALQVVPRRASRSFNLALIDFGALVCTARNPKCRRCPLAERCVFTHRQVPEKTAPRSRSVTVGVSPG
jgi:A/G-specific adenine glycosylase